MKRKKHKKAKISEKNSDGLESKVIEFSNLSFKNKKDKNGWYIPYCNCKWHRGLIEDIKVCEQRNCCFYHKLYISAKTMYINRL